MRVQGGMRRVPSALGLPKAKPPQSSTAQSASSAKSQNCAKGSRRAFGIGSLSREQWRLLRRGGWIKRGYAVEDEKFELTTKIIEAQSRGRGGGADYASLRPLCITSAPALRERRRVSPTSTPRPRVPR